MTRKIFRRSFLATPVVAAVIAIAPASAIAQSSSADAYGGQGGDVQSAVQSGAEPTSANPSSSNSSGSGSSTLPFTGLDIGLMAVGGALLIAVGAGLARVMPRSSES